MGFTKLDEGIVHSSIWSEALATRVLWVTMLAMSDSRGFVSSSRSGLLRAANIPQPDFDLALDILEAPDHDSRSPEHDGRRIQKCDGGWMVLNYVRYREFTYSGSKEAIKKRKQRDKAGHKGDMSPNGGDISASASASASEDLDTRLTQLLVDLMIKNNPKSSIIKRLTPKRHEEWVNQCRLLRTIDQKTPGEIKRVILFSQSDSFWKSNILSMPKLREKWDQLWLKAKVSQPSEGASHPKLSEMSEKDRADLREFEKIKEKMIGEVAKKYDGQIQALRDSGKNDEAFQKLNERQEEFEIEIAKEWRRIKGIKVKGEEARS